jgi:hypothetical protein
MQRNQRTSNQQHWILVSDICFIFWFIFLSERKWCIVFLISNGDLDAAAENCQIKSMSRNIQSWHMWPVWCDALSQDWDNAVRSGTIGASWLGMWTDKGQSGEGFGSWMRGDGSIHKGSESDLVNAAQRFDLPRKKSISSMFDYRHGARLSDCPAVRLRFGVRSNEFVSTHRSCFLISHSNSWLKYNIMQYNTMQYNKTKMIWYDVDQIMWFNSQ